MAAYADIMQALFAKVAAFTSTPALPVAWPEPAKTFTPPADGKYLEVQFFSNRPAWEGLAAGRIDQGLLQVVVVWKRNDGLIRPGQIADAVIAHFDGATMFSGSARVEVAGRPWAASPISTDTELRIPITIPWTA